MLECWQRLGHAKISTTLDLYGHLYHEMQAEAAIILDQLVTPILVDLTKTEDQHSVINQNQTS